MEIDEMTFTNDRTENLLHFGFTDLTEGEAVVSALQGIIDDDA